MSCLSPLEILLLRYLTQVPLTTWPLIIMSLQTVLMFLIQSIYALLMVNLLQSLSLVTLLPLLIRRVDSPYLISFTFLNLSWNYYLLANSPIMIAMSYLYPLLIFFWITPTERLRQDVRSGLYQLESLHLSSLPHLAMSYHLRIMTSSVRTFIYL